ncbi:hypothetical protein ACLOJK_034522 [Asimina triloba]
MPDPSFVTYRPLASRTHRPEASNHPPLACSYLARPFRSSRSPAANRSAHLLVRRQRRPPVRDQKRPSQRPSHVQQPPRLIHEQRPATSAAPIACPDHQHRPVGNVQQAVPIIVSALDPSVPASTSDPSAVSAPGPSHLVRRPYTDHNVGPPAPFCQDLHQHQLSSSKPISRSACPNSSTAGAATPDMKQTLPDHRQPAGSDEDEDNDKENPSATFEGDMPHRPSAAVRRRCPTARRPSAAARTRRPSLHCRPMDSPFGEEGGAPYYGAPAAHALWHTLNVIRYSNDT